MMGCSLKCNTSARVETHPLKTNKQIQKTFGFLATEYNNEEVSFNLFLVHPCMHSFA